MLWSRGKPCQTLLRVLQQKSCQRRYHMLWVLRRWRASRSFAKTGGRLSDLSWRFLGTFLVFFSCCFRVAFRLRKNTQKKLSKWSFLSSKIEQKSLQNPIKNRCWKTCQLERNLVEKLGTSNLESPALVQARARFSQNHIFRMILEINGKSIEK